jgi:hypothetical protein
VHHIWIATLPISPLNDHSSSVYVMSQMLHYLYRAEKKVMEQKKIRWKAMFEEQEKKTTEYRKK